MVGAKRKYVYWLNDPTDGDIWPAYQTAGPLGSSLCHGYSTLYAFSRIKEYVLKISLTYGIYNYEHGIDTESKYIAFPLNSTRGLLLISGLVMMWLVTT